MMYFHSFYNNRKGFSLLEMLIYIAVLTMLSVLVIKMLLGITTLERNITVAKNIQTSTLSVFDRLSREVRSASSVDLATSNLASDSGSLTLILTDENGNPETEKIYLSEGKIYLEQNGSVVGPLTSDSVVVNSLRFDEVSDGTFEAVHITLTITSASRSVSETETFYTGVVLRQS